MKHLMNLLVFTFIINSCLAQSNYWHKPSPYEVSWKKDLVIAGVVAGTYLLGRHVERTEALPHFEMGSFNQMHIDGINPIDRGFAGRWDVNAKDKGKLFKFTASRLVPIGLVGLPGDLKARGSLGLLFLEGYYLNSGLGSLAKGTSNRYRPFSYMSLDDIELLTGEAKEEFLEDIVDDDIEDSFYSGDAAATAYGLMFFAKVINDYYPDSKWRYAVWGAAGFGTTLGAYYRAKSGKHFPTDVLVGSLVGGSLGVLIPHLHKQKDGKLSMLPTNHGLSLTYRIH